MRTFKTLALLGLMMTAPVAADHHGQSAEQKIETILSERSSDLNARNVYRHPKEVLTLFGIEPGMTIIDALPGRWYGSILAPLIGPDGHYIGARYSIAHYRATRDDFEGSDREKNEMAAGDRWTEMVPTLAENAPKPGFIRILEAPEDLYGTVDAYLFFRALHHLSKTDEIYPAAEEAFRLVKPGGIVGVVQHEAREDRDDDWAKGWNGYVKRSRVVDAFTKAGFVLEAESDINANPKDQANVGDIVWRLPPAGGNSEETRAIGESHRMTLKFRKPD